MAERLLLAEELALVAINEESGRLAFGARVNLVTCLAALFLAELILDGHAQIEGKKSVVLVGSGAPMSTGLSGAARVVSDEGPKIKSVLHRMERGLPGLGTPWDAAVRGLVDAGMIAPGSGGGLRGPSSTVVDRDRRNAVVQRLRAAAESDDPLEPRMALLLAMAGWANQYRVMSSGLGERRHAIRRVKHVLDGSQFEPIYAAVRARISSRAAAAAG